MKHYTGVGSRETPQDILFVMEKLALHLSKEGWVLRSGGANGADEAFERGSLTKYAVHEPEIYLPWLSFNLHDSSSKGIILPSKFDNWNSAQILASNIHPAWHNLSPAAKTLHTRNMYQVLGKDLTTPSKFLVCYSTPTKDGYVSGGTRSAYKLAKDRGIPCFNLYNQGDYERITKWLAE